MYYIIETKNQLNYLLGDTEDERCFINIIQNNDNIHPKLSNISLIYYKPFNDKGYIICINHSESLNQIKIEDVWRLLSMYKEVWCLDHKRHKYFTPEDINLLDVNFLKLEKENTIYDLSNIDTKTHSVFYRNKIYKSINEIIPISKHFEKNENLFEIVSKDINQRLPQFYNDMVDVFYFIEKNGIKIDINKLDKYYEPIQKDHSIHDSRIYTHYNLYNLTTRPTNTFNNINFSAIPHDNRDMIIPDNDILVELDYDGYHPRILSELINLPLIKNESAHKQLASYYYGTDSPTDEEVKSSKKLTFNQLYGGINKQYLNIPYFKKIDEVSDVFLKEYNNGIFKLANNRIIKNINNVNKSKLLNYYIQSSETYNNIYVLKNIIGFLKNSKTKLIHYTYDSFLFDVDLSEFLLLEKIYGVMSVTYPMKISYGKDYKNMTKINDLIYLYHENTEKIE